MGSVRLLFTALIISAFFSAPASADYRSTLFVPVGQRTLILEAPLGMCFQSDQIQRVSSRQVELATFIDCGRYEGDDEMPPVTGTISWMNPAIGETTAMSRPEYLDMREPSFRQYTEGSAAYDSNLKMDDKPRRSKNGISLGLAGEIHTDYDKLKGTTVIATTTIRHIPVEIIIRYAGERAPSLERAYSLIDKFMAQQITLNE